jgi:hypothetical protein
MSGLAFSVFSMLRNGSSFFCEFYCHKMEYVYCHMNKLSYYSPPQTPHILDSETLSHGYSGQLDVLDKWTSKYCTCSSSSSWHSSLFQSSFLLMSFSPSTLVACPRGYHKCTSSRVVSRSTATTCKQMF